jgi:hypothetical protein
LNATAVRRREAETNIAWRGDIISSQGAFGFFSGECYDILLTVNFPYGKTIRRQDYIAPEVLLYQIQGGFQFGLV